MLDQSMSSKKKVIVQCTAVKEGGRGCLGALERVGLDIRVGGVEMGGWGMFLPCQKNSPQ